MPVQVSYPGVYIQEVPSGVRTITGVSTSVAAFVGMVQRGRLNVPTRVLSFADYERSFGTDTSASEMTDQVRQFFLNGGKEAWITRIAEKDTAFPASVNLKNEDQTDVLTITAKEVGPDGNSIRVEIDYDTPQPELTFNMRVFRSIVNASGAAQIDIDETFSDLSMNPGSERYVETIFNQLSTLVNITDITDSSMLTPGEGYSISGLILSDNDASALATLEEILGSNGNSIQISVDGSPFRDVVFSQQPAASVDELISQIQADINSNLSGKYVEASLEDLPSAGSRYLKIRSVNGNDSTDLNFGIVEGGSVEIQSAVTNDAAVALQLGTAQGGIEVGGYAPLRPAPSGFFAQLGSTGGAVDALFAFAEANDAGTWELTDRSGASPNSGTPNFVGTSRYEGTAFQVASVTDLVGSLRNVSENLQGLADSIETNTSAGGPSLWKASLQGYRIVLSPSFEENNPNKDANAALTDTTGMSPYSPYAMFSKAANVRSYSLGGAGTGNYQNSGTIGSAGNKPLLPDYSAAFEINDRVVDLFNILILPRATGQTDSERGFIWGTASAFCQRKRAFLLVDPPSDGGAWSTANDVDSGIAGLRIGVVKDHAAIYWPRVQVPTDAGTLRTIDPSGSIAGVMARTDSNRGVWKAPAGLEAAILGIRGVEHSMSDPENGLINPQAVNAIRVFPNGIVSWGARTMDGFDNSGNNDYKYVPVRRLALFIEESLFRGLKFAVFEPNDEPLWAQIRLAAGAFMNNLFRQGAFQGQKARDAYFVKVDSETTTQNDINLGIVNVVVGFAPLKPAEFVVITLQQMAGQVQT